jgi:hypothetical protein
LETRIAVPNAITAISATPDGTIHQIGLSWPPRDAGIGCATDPWLRPRVSPEASFFGAPPSLNFFNEK